MVSNEQVLDREEWNDPAALRELVQRMRPHCLRTLVERFTQMTPEKRDILDDADSLLFEWSVAPDRRTLLPRGAGLGSVAFRVVSQVVQKRLRAEGRHAAIVQELAREGETVTDGAAAIHFDTEAIAGIVLALPATHREVLVAKLRFERGEGPDLAEALGVDAVTARRRLCRARLVLATALKQNRLIEPQEVAHGG
jgi:DNA-directed RNA polymerase specialized sigma24 family protein